MKKSLVLLVTATLLSSLILSACGAPEETTPTTTTPTTTAPATTAPTTTAPATTAPATTTPAPTTPAPDLYGGVYKYPLTVAPTTPLGYPPESAPDAYLIAGVALEKLVLSGNGGVVEPRLATSWDVDINAKTMTFYLRQGVKFHDGSILNADAVKWNFDLAIEAGKVPNWESVEVIDEYTIRISLKEYQNTALSGMGAGSLSIISPAAFEKNGLEWVRDNPVGTGPFRFVEHDRDARVYFEKFDEYWDEGKPYLAGIEFIVIADATVRKLAFERGDVHQYTASGLDAQELSQKGYEYISAVGGTMVLVPDTKNPGSPFADIRVRQAVSHAINREALAAGLGFGFANPAYQLYPGFEISYIPDLDIHEYNPDKARALLAEANYPDGFDTTIYGFTRVVPRDYITAIAAMLDEVGIRTQPEFPEAGKYTELRYEGWSDALMGHGIANFDNINTCHTFYFLGRDLVSLDLPPAYVTAAEASVNSLEVDPALVKASIKVIHDELMAIPYLEERVTTFMRDGAHNPGLLIAPQTQLWGHLLYLEPQAR